MTAAPVSGWAQSAPSAPESAVSPLSVVIGLGAVAGVVGFNASALGLAAFPGGWAYGAAATVPAEMSVAMNRFYAVTTAVGGGWLGESVYSRHLAGPEGPTATGRLLALAGGAIAGVTAFTLVTAPFGAVPLAGAMLEPVPTSVMLGSRLIAAATAGAGALGATWLYNEVAGEHTNTSYALSLLGGAVAGVAVGNLLTAGEVGSLPYYAGSGITQAGGTIASAAANASSRALAVTSGALGALAGAWRYRAATAPAAQ